MIIKIRFGNDWIMYDNLRRVRFGYSSDEAVRFIPQRGDVEAHFERHGRLGLDANPNGWNPMVPYTAWCHAPIAHARHETGTTSDPAPVAWVNAVQDRGDDRAQFDMFIVFDEAYLLNDDGKTIETLR